MLISLFDSFLDLSVDQSENRYFHVILKRLAGVTVKIVICFFIFVLRKCNVFIAPGKNLNSDMKLTIRVSRKNRLVASG